MPSSQQSLGRPRSITNRSSQPQLSARRSARISRTATSSSSGPTAAGLNPTPPVSEPDFIVIDSEGEGDAEDGVDAEYLPSDSEPESNGDTDDDVQVIEAGAAQAFARKPACNGNCHHRRAPAAERRQKGPHASGSRQQAQPVKTTRPRPAAIELKSVTAEVQLNTTAHLTIKINIA